MQIRKGTIGYMLAHEQFPVHELREIGTAAARCGFGLLATSDHFQPWQANEGHSGEAWVTLAALGERAPKAWMGTTVTCPTLRYHPAIVAEAFASLALLNPGRIFLGVGSGEALNEEAATGEWPAWNERWNRLIEALTVIRALWSGRDVDHQGRFYAVKAKLYDVPPQPIPILTAANGPKAIKLAAQHGDGLITDPETWTAHKADWEASARAAGKKPEEMPVLVEQFVAVGEKPEAEQAAELWRFVGKAFQGYQNIRDSAEIQRRAEAELPLDKIMDSFLIGTDPRRHIEAIEKLFASGATIVNIHVGQTDQNRAIEFYGSKVLPHFQQAA